MKNEHVLDLIDDFVDGVLDGDTLRMVEWHLAVCAACRKEAEDMKRLTSELKKLPLEIDPPKGFLTNLPELSAAKPPSGGLFRFRKNGDGIPADADSGPRRILLFRRPEMAVRAAAVLAIAMVGTLAWYVYQPASPDSTGDRVATNNHRAPQIGEQRAPRIAAPIDQLPAEGSHIGGERPSENPETKAPASPATTGKASRGGSEIVRPTAPGSSTAEKGTTGYVTSSPPVKQPVPEAANGNIPNVKSVDDVLKLQPGVVRQSTNLYLRGGSVNELQYLVDGNAQGSVSANEVNEGLASLYAPSAISPTGKGSSSRLVAPAESYDRIYENAYRDAVDQPKSTFSIDVDGASYSNIRRFLNDGQRPPAEAVRIEEMINYFSYAYPQPENGRPFSVKTEMAECPWNSENLLLMVGIRGKDVDEIDIPAGNLVFLIDVSGSMSPANRLPLIKEAFRVLVERLRPEDRVSIVVYAGSAGLVLPPTDGGQKRTILDAINGLEAGGSTAGGAGIRLAYSQAREAFIEGGNNRVILATDGDFNVGVSSDEEMVRLIERERGDGIFLSVIGVGADNLKDSKMEKIADKGNGNYYYFDNIREAKKVFGRQLSGTLYTIAKDVKIQMEFNTDVVSSYRLVGYENRVLHNRDFRDDTKDAGELGAGHTVTALYEIVPVERRRRDVADAAMTDQAGGTQRDGGKRGRAEEAATVSLRFKEPDASTSTEMRIEVPDERPRIDDASADLRFAAAVAEFGMVLRSSEFRGTSSLRQILSLAERALGRDSGGFRAEFLRLVEEYERLGERE